MCCSKLHSDPTQACVTLHKWFNTMNKNENATYYFEKLFILRNYLFKTF